jgi:hypothetical protein
MNEEEAFALLAGIDAPRPLPATLERDLLIALRDDGALLAADVARPLPDDLRRRLEATLTTASARPVPDDVRRHVLRATSSHLPRFAAAAAAVVLVAGSLLVATRDRGSVDDGVDAASEQLTAKDDGATIDESGAGAREFAQRSSAPPAAASDSSSGGTAATSSFAFTVDVVGDRSTSVAAGFDAYIERLNRTGGIDGRTVATITGAPGLLTVNLGDEPAEQTSGGVTLETAFMSRDRLGVGAATVGSAVEVQAERAVAAAYPERTDARATVVVSEGATWDAAADAVAAALRARGVRPHRVRYAPGVRSTGSATFLALSPADARAHLATRPVPPSRGIWGLASAYDDRQPLGALTVLSPFTPAGGAEEAALRAALPDGALTAEAIHGWVTAEATVELLRRTGGRAVTAADLASLAGWRSAWAVAPFGTPAAVPLRAENGRFAPD